MLDGESVRAHLERRTGVAPAQSALDAGGGRVRRGRGRGRRRLLRGARALARARRRRPRGAPRHGGRRPRADRRPRPPDDRAVRAARPPGSAWPRCCSRATTSTCSTSRPTTSTPPAWTCWRSSSTGRRPRSSSSATTASSSAAPSRPSSRSTAACSASPPTAAATTPTSTSARSPVARPARRTRGTPPGATRSTRAPGCSGRGWRRASGTRAARRPTTTSTSSTSAAQTSEKQAAKARQTDKMIERLDVVDEPRKEWQLQMTHRDRGPVRVRSSRSPGTRSLTRGEFTLGPVDLQLDWRDRVAVTGPNGAGKSTLLGAAARPAASRRPARSTSAPACSSARSTRRAAAFEGDEPLVDAFSREVPDWPTADVRTLLAKFGLGGHHIHRPASSQSPGERTRAALALLQARGVNLLVLDEPTNHLDLPAIEQLESALDSFDGHDPAGHARPPDAGDRPPDPPLARRGRPGHRGHRRTDSHGTRRTRYARSVRGSRRRGRFPDGAGTHPVRCGRQRVAGGVLRPHGPADAGAVPVRRRGHAVGGARRRGRAGVGRADGAHHRGAGHRRRPDRRTGPSSSSSPCRGR